MSYSFFVFFVSCPLYAVGFFPHALWYCVACCSFVSCCSRFSSHILHLFIFLGTKNSLCFAFLLIAFNPSTFFPLNVLKFVTLNFSSKSKYGRGNWHAAKSTCLWQHTFWPWSDYQELIAWMFLFQYSGMRSPGKLFNATHKGSVCWSECGPGNHCACRFYPE